MFFSKHAAAQGTNKHPAAQKTDKYLTRSYAAVGYQGARSYFCIGRTCSEAAVPHPRAGGREKKSYGTLQSQQASATMIMGHTTLTQQALPAHKLHKTCQVKNKLRVHARAGCTAKPSPSRYTRHTSAQPSHRCRKHAEPVPLQSHTCSHSHLFITRWDNRHHKPGTFQAPGTAICLLHSTTLQEGKRMAEHKCPQLPAARQCTTNTPGCWAHTTC